VVVEVEKDQVQVEVEQEVIEHLDMVLLHYKEQHKN
jgi:hypothetical protein